jgi:hypothetical protein
MLNQRRYLVLSLSDGFVQVRLMRKKERRKEEER